MSKPHNGGQWTPARMTSFIKSALRGARWPPKYEAIKQARTERKTNPKTGRLAMMHLCNHCNGEFPAKEVVADHIEPVVDPRVGFKDWNTFIDRLYVEVEGFQVLCKDCHKIKTNEERQIARKRK